MGGEPWACCIIMISTAHSWREGGRGRGKEREREREREKGVKCLFLLNHRHTTGTCIYACSFVV